MRAHTGCSRRRRGDRERRGSSRNVCTVFARTQFVFTFSLERMGTAKAAERRRPSSVSRVRLISSRITRRAWPTMDLIIPLA
jgi:hypothetical protein